MRRNRRSQCLFGMGLPFVFLLSVVAVRAQTSPAPTPSPSPAPSLEAGLFKNILRDQKAICTAPVHLERSDAKWLVPASVGWMALVTTDRITGDEIGESERQVTASQRISQAGAVYSLAGGAGSFSFGGCVENDYRRREGDGR